MKFLLMQGIIGTGIAIDLSSGTHGRIALRSGQGVKHSLNVNTRVIDADYTGEIKIVLVNLGTTSYKVNEREKIAQLNVKTILNDEAILVQDLEATTRATKGFGSSAQGVTKEVNTAPDCLVSHLQKIPGPMDPTEDQNTPNGTSVGRMHISDITHREFR